MATAAIVSLPCSAELVFLDGVLFGISVCTTFV